jgi:hypothetical protein
VQHSLQVKVGVGKFFSSFCSGSRQGLVPLLQAVRDNVQTIYLHFFLTLNTIYSYRYIYKAKIVSLFQEVEKTNIRYVPTKKNARIVLKEIVVVRF